MDFETFHRNLHLVDRNICSDTISMFLGLGYTFFFQNECLHDVTKGNIALEVDDE